MSSMNKVSFGIIDCMYTSLKENNVSFTNCGYSLEK